MLGGAIDSSVLMPGITGWDVAERAAVTATSASFERFVTRRGRRTMDGYRLVYRSTDSASIGSAYVPSVGRPAGFARVVPKAISGVEPGSELRVDRARGRSRRYVVWRGGSNHRPTASTSRRFDISV